MPSFVAAVAGFARSHWRAVRLLVGVSVLLSSCCCSADEDGPVIRQVASMEEITGRAAKAPPKDAMTELLHWGIEHSDPDAIKELMAKYKDNNLTLADVYGKDALDSMFVDEGGAMRELVGDVSDFRNVSQPDEDLTNALERLQEFVEQVDNAGNLHRMGGLEPLLGLAVGDERSAEIRTLALWTLGVAVQNNEPVQADLISIEGLRFLGWRLGSCGRPAELVAGDQFLVSGDWNQVDEDAQYCGKLLYALSGLMKNNDSTQIAAHKLGIFDWLLVAGIHHPSLSVVKKSISLLETVLAQTPDLPILDHGHARKEVFTETLLGLIRGTGATDTDTDKAEKALHLINRILSMRPTLFPTRFRPELMAAVRNALQRCEDAVGKGEESCTDITDLGSQADSMLAAIDVSDDEL